MEEETNWTKIIIRSVIGGILALFLLVLGYNSYTTVGAGSVKVGTLFGDVKGTLDEGFHVVNPLYDFTTFDAKQKTILFKGLLVPSADQLTTTFDISVQYRIKREMAGTILVETGTPQNLIDVHLTPKFRSVLREISKGVARAEDFYEKDVQQRIQSELFDSLSIYCAPKGLEIQQVLIRSVTLPPVITTAVEEKKKRQQDAEKQKAELARYKVEMEQKLAEAKANKDAAVQEAIQIKLLADAEAYKILAINKAIAKNPAFIQLKAMEALQAISKDPAAKIYFLNGDSPNPLPLMHIGGRK